MWEPAGILKTTLPRALGLAGDSLREIALAYGSIALVFFSATLFVDTNWQDVLLMGLGVVFAVAALGYWTLLPRVYVGHRFTLAISRYHFTSETKLLEEELDAAVTFLAWSSSFALLGLSGATVLLGVTLLSRVFPVAIICMVLGAFFSLASVRSVRGAQTRVRQLRDLGGKVGSLSIPYLDVGVVRANPAQRWDVLPLVLLIPWTDGLKRRLRSLREKQQKLNSEFQAKQGQCLQEIIGSSASETLKLMNDLVDLHVRRVSLLYYDDYVRWSGYSLDDIDRRVRHRVRLSESYWVPIIVLVFGLDTLFGLWLLSAQVRQLEAWLEAGPEFPYISGMSNSRPTSGLVAWVDQAKRRSLPTPQIEAELQDKLGKWLPLS